MMKSCRAPCALLALLFAAAAPASSGEGNDLSEAKERLKRMIKIGNPDQEAPAKSLAAIGGEIVRLEGRLATVVGPAEWRTLEKRHRGAGPCLRYGRLPAPSDAELEQAVNTYGASFLEDHLSELAHRVAERERAAHVGTPDDEYLDLVRQVARSKFEPGEAAYWIGLAERRQELYQEYGQVEPPPPVPPDLARRFDELLRRHPALGSGENRLALLYHLADRRTGARGQELAVRYRRLSGAAHCAAPLSSLAVAGESTPLIDGWGHPFALEKKGTADCALVSYGKDGVPGGQGPDADRRF